MNVLVTQNKEGCDTDFRRITRNKVRSAAAVRLRTAVALKLVAGQVTVVGSWNDSEPGSARGHTVALTTGVQLEGLPAAFGAKRPTQTSSNLWPPGTDRRTAPRPADDRDTSGYSPPLMGGT
jgi:hypothetical protein